LAVALVPDLGAVVGAAAVAGFFVAILLHELAHAAVARRFGITTTVIELWGLGGIARLAKDPPSPRADGWIAAAGPLSNALVGGLAVLVAWLLDGAGAPGGVVVSVAWFAAVNVALAAFNVLPGAPLDGGRIFRAVRWSRHGQRYRAMRESAVLGTILGWGLAALGASLMFNGRSGLWVLVSGLFMVVSARVDAAAALIGERLGSAKVNEYTWYGVAEAGSDMDVDSMLWQRTRLGGAGAVAVRGEQGTLDGLVLEDEMWAVPADVRSMTMLTQLMAPLHLLPRADVDDDLASVLPSVNPLRPVVTVWRNGNLMGVIPPTVIRERIRALFDRPVP
jgi:Zn-dependent protease